jgi:hypothetical protein
MTEQNYFPFINQGHTMRMAAKIDPTRLYNHPIKIRLGGIGLYPAFEWGCDIPNYYGEYLVLWVGEDIFDATMDCDILISLN